MQTTIAALASLAVILWSIAAITVSAEVLVGNLKRPKLLQGSFAILKAERIGESDAKVEALAATLADRDAEFRRLDAVAEQRDADHKKREEDWARRYSAMNETFKECDDRIGHLNDAMAEKERSILFLTGIAEGRGDRIEDLERLLGLALDADRDHLLALIAAGTLTPMYFQGMRDGTEKRVRVSYSKGYALGHADARERVREVIAVEPELS